LYTVDPLIIAVRAFNEVAEGMLPNALLFETTTEVLDEGVLLGIKE
jgi:hypothetical protein